MRLTLESIRQLYQLDNIIRYNTFPKHKQETVATHSYYVALFTMMLCDELGVGSEIKARAIEIALVHDIPEVVTNDITHDAKDGMPEINAILEKYEKEILWANFPTIFRYMFMNDVPNLIVKLADTISVLQFTDYELQMGNRYMLENEWLEKTVIRIQDIKQKIERMGISCQKITI